MRVSILNKLLEKIYFNLPVSLQNMAVSAIGIRLKHERFGKYGIEQLKKLDQAVENSNYESIIDLCFREISRHAIETTPYYRKMATDRGIHWTDIKGIGDIRLFPVIEKKDLLRNPGAFVSSYPGQPKKFHLYTSGTTGTPLKITTDKVSRQKHYAFFTALRKSYGVLNGDRRITFFGRIITTPNEKKVFWRHDYFNKNVLASSYHLSKENMEKYYSLLLSYQPDEIFAYPSSLFTLATWMIENRKPKFKLKLVMTTAERLLDYQSDAIARAFDAPLVDQYGCTEMSFFAYRETQSEDIQLSPYHGFSEVIDHLGNISSIGHGTHLSTGFINYSMPVIRYNIGDTITLDRNSSNGSQFIRELDGREDDIILSENLTPIGRLDPIFKAELNITSAQIIQRSDLSIDVFIIASDKFTSDNSSTIKYEMEKRIGTNIKVRINEVDQLIRSKSGKFRPVISEVRRT